jgi:hypothetical protein
MRRERTTVIQFLGADDTLAWELRIRRVEGENTMSFSLHWRGQDKANYITDEVAEEIIAELTRDH